MGALLSKIEAKSENEHSAKIWTIEMIRDRSWLSSLTLQAFDCHAVFNFWQRTKHLSKIAD